MIRLAVIGASGYTGAEVLRLAVTHPELEVVVATGEQQAGVPIAEAYPSLGAAYGDRRFEPYRPEVVEGCDAVILGLPHGRSHGVVADARGRVRWVLDLSADFRLTDAAAYPQWYDLTHPAPELLDEAVYGLPELFGDQLDDAWLVALPGCYPTATALALAPLLASGLVEPAGIVVDAASGVSGAGRPPKPSTTFCTVDEDFTAYGLLNHRHTPEIEQTVCRLSGSEASVLFTPHLAPMSRGILATCYARPTGNTATEALLEHYRTYYADAPFVQVLSGSPSTKATAGSNSAHVTVRQDPRTGWVVALCAIDNLVKGAAGQAVQCLNRLAGLPETTGLTPVGLAP